MEPAPGVTQRKERIQAALGRSGRVLAEVIPTLEFVIGPQPAATQLGAAEARNRFNYRARSLVKAIEINHQMVVFLDDPRWSDRDSLSLLDALVSSDDLNHLLITDTVADQVARRLRHLSADTPQFLQRVACVGSHVMPATLAFIADEPPDTARVALRGDVEEGLKALTTGSSYRFAHDRVRQAVSAQVPDQERQAWHWRIGTCLPDERDSAEVGEQRAERLFEIVNHLNIGAHAFVSSLQMVKLAEPNGRAGWRVRERGAVSAASGYVEMGVRGRARGKVRLATGTATPGTSRVGWQR